MPRSAALRTKANWMDGEAFPQLGSDAEVAVGRFDEIRLGEPDLTDQAPATLHVGADLFVPAGTAVYAPLDATVVRVDGHAVVLQSRVDTTMFFVRLAGVASHFGLRSLDEERQRSASARLPPPRLRSLVDVCGASPLRGDLSMCPSCPSSR